MFQTTNQLEIMGWLKPPFSTGDSDFATIHGIPQLLQSWIYAHSWGMYADEVGIARKHVIWMDPLVIWEFAVETWWFSINPC